MQLLVTKRNDVQNLRPKRVSSCFHTWQVFAKDKSEPISYLATLKKDTASPWPLSEHTSRCSPFLRPPSVHNLTTLSIPPVATTASGAPGGSPKTLSVTAETLSADATESVRQQPLRLLYRRTLSSATRKKCSLNWEAGLAGCEGLVAASAGGFEALKASVGRVPTVEPEVFEISAEASALSVGFEGSRCERASEGETGVPLKSSMGSSIGTTSARSPVLQALRCPVSFRTPPSLSESIQVLSS
jgi:hypothetical protein